MTANIKLLMAGILYCISLSLRSRIVVSCMLSQNPEHKDLRENRGTYSALSWAVLTSLYYSVTHNPRFDVHVKNGVQVCRPSVAT